MLRYLLSALAIAMAALFILLDPQFFAGNPGQPVSDNLPVIGQATPVKGGALSRLPRAFKSKPVNQGKPFHNQETLETLPDGEISVKFRSGAEIKVHENSRIVAEADAADPDVTNVTILAGTLEVTEGPEMLRLYRGGKRVMAGELGSPQVEQIKISDQTPPPPAPEEPAVTATQADDAAPTPEPKKTPPRTLPPYRGSMSSETLAQDDINRTIRGQSGFFNRCYLNYSNRTRNQNRKGSAVLSFVIQTSGKPSGTRVLNSTFKDEVLHKCLVEVIDRTTFKPFSGKPIQMEYPLAFE